MSNTPGQRGGHTPPPPFLYFPLNIIQLNLLYTRMLRVSCDRLPEIRRYGYIVIGGLGVAAALIVFGVFGGVAGRSRQDACRLGNLLLRLLLGFTDFGSGRNPIDRTVASRVQKLDL